MIGEMAGKKLPWTAQVFQGNVRSQLQPQGNRVPSDSPVGPAAHGGTGAAGPLHSRVRYSLCQAGTRRPCCHSPAAGGVPGYLPPLPRYMARPTLTSIAAAVHDHPRTPPASTHTHTLLASHSSRGQHSTAPKVSHADSLRPRLHLFPRPAILSPFLPLLAARSLTSSFLSPPNPTHRVQTPRKLSRLKAPAPPTILSLSSQLSGSGRHHVGYSSGLGQCRPLAGRGHPRCPPHHGHCLRLSF